MPKSSVFKEESRKYKPTNKKFRKKGEKTRGKGRHKAKKVGDRINFKTERGRKSGKVVEVHKEYYIVQCKNSIHKVNRKSILYSMGYWAGRVAGVPGGIRGRVKKIKTKTRESYSRGKQESRTRIVSGKKKKKRKKKKP